MSQVAVCHRLGVPDQRDLRKWPRASSFVLMPTKKQKKVDYEALQSPLMRVPRIDVDTVRDLLDLGYQDIHELVGRAPEVLFGNLKDLKPNAPDDRLNVFRMVVYYAETPDPDPDKLHPWAWRD